jgi:hypothetical protein
MASQFGETGAIEALVKHGANVNTILPVIEKLRSYFI